MSVKRKGSESEDAILLKNMVYTLGNKLGFISDTEIKQYTTNIRFESEYEPEIDAVWYYDLSKIIDASKIEIINKQFESNDLHFFPLVGFEIEASDPTSKTQLSNAANLYLQHYPYGFIIIDENKAKKDLYHRAAGILRTFRFQYGQVNYLPLSKGQLEKILKFEWKNKKEDIFKFEKVKLSKGSGGEVGDAKIIRDKLTQLGDIAGFNIYHDWSPEDLSYDYQLRKDTLKALSSPSESIERFLGKKVSWNPNDPKIINRWYQFYIRPKIDVIWSIGLSLRFYEFYMELLNLEPDFKYNLPIYRDPSKPFPIIGFEIESSIGKHAGGGILNLAKYTHFGFIITQQKNIDLLNKRIKTYSRSLGINNVYPLSIEELSKYEIN